MPSVITGYEYDIFISYRHKDNRYDGWVSEFVNNLRKEIEATFKDDISIYFDENSYDGLLENHQVDESLRKKLKCLIFIPVISQTYCDEKSFAWHNEFLFFLNSMADDTFGLKIDLVNGNVGSRILPVRIHEIDEEDKKLIEAHLGGPMRSIEFIYRSAGVNRPLRPKDDDLKNNDVKVLYRNQVNKVANAIKEIVYGIRAINGHQVPGSSKLIPTFTKAKPLGRILGFAAAIILALSLIAYVGLFYFKDVVNPGYADLGKSIAIIPFRDLSADKSQQYFGDGVAEMIRTKLSHVADLSVTSMQSVIQYRESKKTIPQIGEELKVSYVLEGSILKEGSSVRVIVQLIEAGKDSHVWSETYDRNLSEIFAIQSDIAQHVATMLKLKLTDRENEDVKAHHETSIRAYDYILAGQYSFSKLANARDHGYTDQAIAQFKAALQLDSISIEALAGLGRTFATKAYFGEGQHWLDSAYATAEKMLRINPDRAEGYALLGRVYYERSEQQKAKLNLEKAVERDPNNTRALGLLSYIYKEERNFEKGIPLAIKVARLSPSGNSEQINPQFFNIGNVLFEGGYFDLAEEAWQKHTTLYPDDFDANEGLFYLRLLQGKSDDAKKILADRLNRPIDLDNIADINRIIDYAWVNYVAHQYDTAQRYLLAVKRLDSLGFEEGIHTHIYKHRLAHIYKIKGQTAKSDKLFKEHLAQLEQTVKEGKSRFGLEYDLAGAYSFLGKRDKAYYWLEKLPYNMLLSVFIQIDPMFDPIRNEVQFKKIIDRQNSEREAIRKVIETEKVQQELKLVLR